MGNLWDLEGIIWINFVHSIKRAKQMLSGFTRVHNLHVLMNECVLFCVCACVSSVELSDPQQDPVI